jgi:competence protein ComEC
MVSVRKVFWALCLSLLFLFSGTKLSAARKVFTLYFIDVEGGESILAVSPSGHSLLMDVGDARYEDRVIQVAKLAHLNHIDAVVITHYHTDHVGGVLSLTNGLPVGIFYDHGPNVEEDNTTDGAPQGGYPKEYSEAFEKSRSGHKAINPGDKIPIAGLDVTVLGAADKAITQPLPVPGAGEPNAYCTGLVANQEAPPGARGSEDSHAVALLVRFGNFSFANFSDSGGGRVGKGNIPFDVLCPNNLIGKLDVLVTPTHAILPPLTAFGATKPRVAVADNSARKGGGSETIKGYRELPGFEDLWALHLNVVDGTEFRNEFVANLNEQNCPGHYLKISARSDGSFTVYNSRNGFQKTYPARAAK